MQLRRSTALLAGALLLAVPLTTSCGMSGRDDATNREYTPAAGTNERDASVDVLGAVVVSAQPGSGTFIATFANNTTSASSVDAVEGAAGGAPVEIKGFSPLEVPSRGRVNLAEDDQGIALTGEFEAGQYVDLQVTVAGGEQVRLHVPVVPDDNEFDGLDSSS